MSEIDVFRIRLLQLVQEDKWDEIPPILIGRHAADIAGIISQVSGSDAKKLFSLVNEESQPDVLRELHGQAEEEVLESLSIEEISDIIEEMAPDDAVDVLADLSEHRSEQVLDLLEDEESRDMRALLEYDEDTAGGIMTTDVVAFRKELTVGEALEQITYMEDVEPFYFAYVVNETGVLQGVIALWELLRVKDKQVALIDIAHKELAVAYVKDDQEEVARLMSRYDLSAIPVVDDSSKLIGRITFDDVIDVMEEEASEDLFRMAGSDEIELESTSPLQACKVRLPWLLITLGITFLSSLILRRFLLDLEEVLALSFFVPVVMAMSGGTGMQSSTLIVRSLALGSFEGVHLGKMFFREILIAVMMGLACAALLWFGVDYVISKTPEHATLYSSGYLAMTVAIALVCSMTFAATFGAIVPIVLDRWKIDPAVASGPFVTASNDIMSILIYYVITIIMLAYHQGLGGG